MLDRLLVEDLHDRIDVRGSHDVIDHDTERRGIPNDRLKPTDLPICNQKLFGQRVVFGPVLPEIPQPGLTRSCSIQLMSAL